MKYFLIALATLAFSNHVLAGAGHDHGESAFAGGTGPATHFDLTDQQMANLGIKSTKAKLLSMQKTVDMLAFTELLPERKEAIAPHFEGKIANIKVQIGERVKKGQTLARVIPVNSVGVNNQPISLKSSKNGMVIRIFSLEGDVVQSGEDIMHIGDPTQMLVRGVSYETPDISSIEVEQNVEVHLDVDPDRHIDGKVQRINRVIDPESRTFSVYALIDTPEGDIQPGLQGTMEIFTGDDTPVLAVPKRSVLGELGSYFVYVIKGQEVEKRDVTVGTKSSHHIGIKSGLSPNERVVTNGNYQLQYISIGGIQEHEHDEKPHDEQEGHSHDDGHVHKDNAQDHRDEENHEDHEGHDDHSGHDH